VSITVVESVYSAVRTDSIYKADYVSSLKGKPPRRDVAVGNWTYDETAFLLKMTDIAREKSGTGFAELCV